MKITTVATRLRESREEAGFTQTQLAKKARLKNQSIIGSLESGHRKTSSHLPAIAVALGVDSLWLAEGRGPKRAVPLPTGSDPFFEGKTQNIESAAPETTSGAVFYMLDAEAACGDGRQNADYPEIVRSIVLSDDEARDRIGSLNRSGSIQVIMATGDSMVPTIQPRDLLFVDTAITEFSGDGIYLIRRDHGLSCKRLSMAGRTLLVTSDNPVARDWKWKDKRESDAIIGRVLAALPMTFKQF